MRLTTVISLPLLLDFTSKRRLAVHGIVTSYDRPWGLRVNFLGNDFPNVTSCSSIYTSVLFW